MTATPSLRARILDRRPLRGPFIAIPSPVAVELTCGGEGADFLCIDTEHSPISDALLTDMLRAAELCRTPAMVRTRSGQPRDIAAALDAGAAGILVPHVSTPEAAARAVAAARFPPEGSRGCGPGRAAGYLRDIAGHLDRARRDTVVAIQLETAEAVDNADAILAVPGIDLAFIGPGDLGVDLAARRGDGADLDAAIAGLLDAAAAAGVPAGIFTADRAASARWMEKLAFVIEGSDALWLTRAADAALAPL